MTAFDGPTLRAVRESMGIPLRRVARHAGMSHGHLSKVERGEYGRPVTPAVIHAYEKATGVKLAEAVAAAVDQGELPAGGRRPRVWRPGQMTDLARRSYNAIVAALSIGGHIGEPYGRLLDTAGRPMSPSPPETADLVQLEQLTELLVGLDLRFGGGLVSQLTKAILRWAVPMLEADTDEATGSRLCADVSGLAHRAAWAAFDVAAHEAARTLFRLALYTAVRAHDPNLRAHVLVDIAAQHSFLGYHEDALELVRFAEGDERIHPAVRVVLNGVKARNHAALGEDGACRSAIELAERAHAAVGEASLWPGWVATIVDQSRLYAITGHAFGDLVERTGDKADLDEAQDRLTQAIDTLDASTHTRAHALCTARLARLCLRAGDLERASHWGRMAAVVALTVRSVRLDRHLNQLRAEASSNDHPTIVELLTVIDEAMAGTGGG